MSLKILIIEDEEKIARFIELELGYEGYSTTKAFDGRTGLELAETGEFDLILLDVMLPQMSGMEVLRRIRRVSSVPVILLTARDSVIDKVSGLDSGANDYITKPFAIEELLARIRTTLRLANKSEQSELLSASGLQLDTSRHTVNYRDTAIDLTKREFDLLYFLLKNKDLVVSRKPCWRMFGVMTMPEIPMWLMSMYAFAGKIDEVFSIKLIHTVRGVGYVIKDD